MNNKNQPSGADIGKLPGVHCLNDVESEDVEWLVPGWIPFGKLTILDGNPGEGKTTLLINIAADATRGYAPFGGLVEGGERSPIKVILLTAEDGLGDTIKPRLIAAGGDPTRFYAVSEIPIIDQFGVIQKDKDGDPETQAIMLPDHVDYLKALIDVDPEIRLIIIDPIIAYLSGRTDANKDQDIRRALKPLAALGEKTGVAIIGIRHLNKQPGGQAIYRGGGSIGIIGAARSGMLLAVHPQDKEKRVLAQIKNNLAQKAASLVIRLEPTEEGSPARVVWESSCDFDADVLLTPPKQSSAGAPRNREAQSFLWQFLQDGCKTTEEVIEQAKTQGISKQTLYRAKKELSVESHRAGPIWVWQLKPDTQAPSE